MLLKSIEFNPRELPETIKVQVTEDELNFLRDNMEIGFSFSAPQIDADTTIEISIPCVQAARLVSYCGRITGDSSPNHQITSEIYDCLNVVFNAFYDEGYGEAIRGE